MRVRIEKVSDSEPEEVVIYCRNITPEVEAIARQLRTDGKIPSPIAFFKGDEQYYLDLKEILFFDTDRERVFAHTADDSFEIKLRLYELEATLPGYYIRVSRSTIVNIIHVYSIQKSLTRVYLISFRKTHKSIYGSRMYSLNLLKKMEERSQYEKS